MGPEPPHPTPVPLPNPLPPPTHPLLSCNTCLGRGCFSVPSIKESLCWCIRITLFAHHTTSWLNEGNHSIRVVFPALLFLFAPT